MKNAKLILPLVAVFFAICLGLASFTVVDTGTVKTVKLFGKLHDKPLTEGVHFVNPLSDLSTYNTKEITTTDTISIPAKDKFSSDAILTVRWSFNGAMAPKIQEELGSMGNLETNIVRTPFVALVKEAGRNVEKSQDLFNEATQSKVENIIRDGLIRETTPYGITIHAVYLGNIELDPIIYNAIKVTKDMQEKEEQEKSTLRREEIKFQQKVKKSEADLQVARNSAAEKRVAADADLYVAQNKAKANMKLGKSVTPELLDLKAMEVDLARAKQWNGSVPQTIMGDTAKALPLFKLN